MIMQIKLLVVVVAVVVVGPLIKELQWNPGFTILQGGQQNNIVNRDIVINELRT